MTPSAVTPSALTPSAVTPSAALAASVALVAALGVASAALGAARAAASPARGVPGPAPLSAALPSTEGTWVTIPLGDPTSPSDTFWQVFLLPGGKGRWVLRTPPGVADNGGVVLSGNATSMTVGFRPSNLLRFSPLAVTTDGGASYTPGLVPGGLAATPDALGAGPGGEATAVTGTGSTATVLARRPGGGAWRPLATLASVAASGAGRACDPAALVAAATPAAGPTIGVTCQRPGRVGIFRLGPSGGTHLTGPPLPTSGADATVTVVRLRPDGRGLATLLGLSSGGRTRYLAAWDPSGGGRWSESPLRPATGALRSASFTSGDGFALVEQGAGGPVATVVEPDRAGWTALPAPPPATTVMAVTDGRTDALSGGRTTFTDAVLHGSRWVGAQRISVAVPFGSSG